jgi:RNA polymerase sigma-70 factor, ECF subfamily
VENFDEIYLEEHPRLHRTLRAVVGDSATAEELVQEAFLRAYRHRDRYDPRWKPGVWLHAIALNLARSHLRRRKLISFLPLLDLHHAPEDSIGDPDLVAALGELPTGDRAALVLNVLHGYTYEEIGRILDVPAGTVGSRINRARRRLQRRLEPIYRAATEASGA